MMRDISRVRDSWQTDGVRKAQYVYEQEFGCSVDDPSITAKLEAALAQADGERVTLPTDVALALALWADGVAEPPPTPRRQEIEAQERFGSPQRTRENMKPKDYKALTHLVRIYGVEGVRVAAGRVLVRREGRPSGVYRSQLLDLAEEIEARTEYYRAAGRPTPQKDATSYVFLRTYPRRDQQGEKNVRKFRARVKKALELSRQNSRAVEAVEKALSLGRDRIEEDELAAIFRPARRKPRKPAP
jgi:hypothetical protein